jgi:uncharacterized protein YcbK (DUF882 family)
MSSAPDGIIAPELKRLRKLLAQKRRDPIRIIIATDPTRPVRTLTIPRFVPAALLVASALLVAIAVGLSFSTWTMSGKLTGLKNRVVAMMKLADDMATAPESVAQAGVLRPSLSAVNVHKPSGAQARFTIELATSGEQLEVVLDLASGDMDEASYRAVKHFMRCRRTGAESPIDPRLIEMLYKISQRSGEKIVLISGFRSPAFAAPASYHTRGMAADIRIPGMTTLMVRDLARSMGVRGVGYYPRSQFVHVDLRDEPFFWTDLGSGEGTEVEVENGNVEAASANEASSAAQSASGSTGM